MANVGIVCSKQLIADELDFLKEYPDNYGFLVYSTSTGNRVSIEIYYTPDSELKYGVWNKGNPSGYEISLGSVHYKLAYENRRNIKAKIDKLVSQSSVFEEVARKYGYPNKGLWSIYGWAEDKVLRYEEMRKELKQKINR